MPPGQSGMLYGSTLASSWVHSMLFIVEFVLAILYCYQFNVHGPRRFNLIVNFLVVNAVGALIATCANAWKLLIIHPASPPVNHSWPIPLMVIFSNIASTIEQCFLLYRYYTLSRRMHLTGLVLLLIVANATSGFTAAVYILVRPEYPMTTVTTAISYYLGAIVDVLLPILIIWELRQIRTTYSGTQSLIRRVIVNAASSGAIVAVVEILLLVLFWIRSPAIVLVGAALDPLYGITVLINLSVCQQRVSHVIPPRNKTGNLTSSLGLDSSQPQQSTNRNCTSDPEKNGFSVIASCHEEEPCSAD